MLGGRRPFVAVDSDPMSMIMRHVRDPAPLLSSVWAEAPPELEQLVARTLQKEPDDRPTADELAADFARADGQDTDSLQFVVGLRAWF